MVQKNWKSPFFHSEAILSNKILERGRKIPNAETSISLLTDQSDKNGKF